MNKRTNDRHDHPTFQLEALKRTVDRTATDLEVARSQVTRLKQEVTDKQTKYASCFSFSFRILKPCTPLLCVVVYLMWNVCRLQQAKEVHENLIEKLKIVTESELSAEEKAAQYEELMQQEEKRTREIEAELKRLRDQLFKRTQELQQVKTKERNTEAEIQVCQSFAMTKALKSSEIMQVRETRILRCFWTPEVAKRGEQELRLSLWTRQR